jgi:hypothetical protein
VQRWHERQTCTGCPVSAAGTAGRWQASVTPETCGTL